MSSKLEKFIRDHREEFDAEEPAPRVWKKLEEQLDVSSSDNKIHRLALVRWTAVAAMTIFVMMGVFYFMNKSSREAVARRNATPVNDIISAINPAYAKEVYHFTELIEMKQSELKTIGKEQPQLYKEFLTDITTLDSSYNALKKELPQNPNREQLLEAMIENLRLQAELLNQQLLIIKKIKQAKNASNETSSKTI